MNCKEISFCYLPRSTSLSVVCLFTEALTNEPVLGYATSDENEVSVRQQSLPVLLNFLHFGSHHDNVLGLGWEASGTEPSHSSHAGDKPGLV